MDKEVVFEPEFEVEVDEDEREIIFMPGCFDDFEGTQEELDAFIEELKEMFKSGEMEELSEELDEEDYELIEQINEKTLQ